jgi:hypothetical protein
MASAQLRQVTNRAGHADWRQSGRHHGAAGRRTDGFVNGMICHAPDEPGCRAIEVESGHVGVQLRPEVLRVITDVLAGTREPRH